MEDIFCVVTFEITQHALIFEKYLKDNNLYVKLMPVPRQLSTSCGIAAYVNCDEKDSISALCKDKSIIIGEFHELKTNKKNLWFMKHLKSKT
ncbi:DUF3343 domain-containing protein [Tissierella sp. Yu-01]|uniref:DUF3343 domain-containing protein n=1 Tax=Tissierella sp. Yu-01 TaxID=3035694 RepID=UPI00240D090D|nr:DUF3343 domain-containing protein [Tissierella sp. Yu-01]WFA10392.1 DUF3343 domain-containing protein [Tissierella sp. Yu-01]